MGRAGGVSKVLLKIELRLGDPGDKILSQGHRECTLLSFSPFSLLLSPFLCLPQFLAPKSPGSLFRLLPVDLEGELSPWDSLLPAPHH